jgi:ATP-dependent DNA ligase
LLPAYYDSDGRLVYAGRVGSGINRAELARLRRRLQPLATDKMPLEVPPPRSNRFGSPLVFKPGALGAARAGRRGQIPDLTDGSLLRQASPLRFPRG